MCFSPSDRSPVAIGGPNRLVSYLRGRLGRADGVGHVREDGAEARARPPVGLGGLRCDGHGILWVRKGVMTVSIGCFTMNAKYIKAIPEC